MAKALATAAKRYGLYVSDNGADFHVQGEPNAAWDLRTNGQMSAIKMSDMEFVDLGTITRDPRFSPDSMAARKSAHSSLILCPSGCWSWESSWMVSALESEG